MYCLNPEKITYALRANNVYFKKTFMYFLIVCIDSRLIILAFCCPVHYYDDE